MRWSSYDTMSISEVRWADEGKTSNRDFIWSREDDPYWCKRRKHANKQENRKSTHWMRSNYLMSNHAQIQFNAGQNHCDAHMYQLLHLQLRI